MFLSGNLQCQQQSIEVTLHEVIMKLTCQFNTFSNEPSVGNYNANNDLCELCELDVIMLNFNKLV